MGASIAMFFRSGTDRLGACLAMLAVALLAGCADGPPPPDRARPDGADFRLATYNVHYLDLAGGEDGKWGLKNWQSRRDGVVGFLRLAGPDIVALQEVETDGAPTAGRRTWLNWLRRAMPEYRAAAVTGAGAAMGQPIFYRPGKFHLLEDGHAFLNDPNARFRSIRALAGYPDAVTWARLRHRASGRVITVFNLHLHFFDTGLRLRSTRTVLRLAMAAQARGDAVFITGDFNARRNSRSLRLFYEAGFLRTEQQGATFHFNTGTHLFGAIDHMLYDRHAVPVGRSVTERRKMGGQWPSDHYPVWTDFRLLP